MKSTVRIRGQIRSALIKQYYVKTPGRREYTCLLCGEPMDITDINYHFNNKHKTKFLNMKEYIEQLPLNRDDGVQV